MSWEIGLEPNFDNSILMNPAKETIELSPLDYCALYLTEIQIADPVLNVHEKKLVGTLQGSVSSIRARVHYPKMAGEGWTAGVNPQIYASTKAVVYSLAFPYGNFKHDGFYNQSYMKERTFYGGSDGTVVVDGKTVPASMYYSVDGIGRTRPEWGDADYYSDGLGITYPYTSPSSWFSGTINPDETFEIDIEMNRFWKSGLYIDWHSPYNADFRMQMVEIEIYGRAQNQDVYASRIYYIWHVPQCFAVEKTAYAEEVRGTYEGPFNLQACGGIGCQYLQGFNAEGGSGYFDNYGTSVVFDNILMDCFPEMDDSEEKDHVSCDLSIYNVTQIKNIYAVVEKIGATFDPTDPSSYEYMEELITTGLSLDGDWIVSEEFKYKPGTFPAEVNEWVIYLLLDFTSYKFGSVTSNYSSFSGAGIYCAPGVEGALRYIPWCTLYPGCSEVCYGVMYEYCYTGITYPSGWVTADTSIFKELNDFDHGMDYSPFTSRLELGNVDILSYGKCNDGGKTPVKISHSQGVKYGYNNYGDTQIPPYWGGKGIVNYDVLYYGSSISAYSIGAIYPVNYIKVDGAWTSDKIFSRTIIAERVAV
jgi:hypothetical protein